MCENQEKLTDFVYSKMNLGLKKIACCGVQEFIEIEGKCFKSVAQMPPWGATNESIKQNLFFGGQTFIEICSL